MIHTLGIILILLSIINLVLCFLNLNISIKDTKVGHKNGQQVANNSRFSLPENSTR